MAKRARSSRPQSADVQPTGPLAEPTVPPADGVGGPATDGNSTGRFIVVFADTPARTTEAMTSVLRASGCRRVETAGHLASHPADIVSVMDTVDATILDDLGIAILPSGSPQLSALQSVAAADSSSIVSVEPEGFCYADGTVSSEYLRGFRDAASHLLDASQEIPAIGAPETGAAATAGFADTATMTWGLQATRVNTSRYTGQGVSVAILDTGFDLRHRDFQGRTIVSASFVPGQTVQDRHGHGTHCAGTACGPQSPAGTSRRYGCAPLASLHVGKVLCDQDMTVIVQGQRIQVRSGGGLDSWILSGMQWAIHQRCAIISMSLGSQRPPMQAYELAGQRALAAGSLVVAATGNDSQRPYWIAPAGTPANVPSILAVGGLDTALGMYQRSNGSGTQPGTKVDITGPGVSVYSAVPGSYNWLSGTSMATPHVAGIAALWAQATGLRGAALYQRVASNARPLSLPVTDVGFGLVQAPQ